MKKQVLLFTFIFLFSIPPFSSTTNLPHSPSLANSGPVKFAATALENEKYGAVVCYGSYYCKVHVDKVLSDPQGLLSNVNTVEVCFGPNSLGVKLGDKLEVYGYYWKKAGPLQNIGRVVGYGSNYYVHITSFRVDLWVDKGCNSKYFTGDSLVIYYGASNNATVQLIEVHNGTFTLYQGNVQGGILYELVGVVKPPAGIITFTLKGWSLAGDYVENSCVVYVAEKKPALSLDVNSFTEKVIPGETVKVEGVINNSGETNASSITLNLFMNNETLYSSSLGDLKGGEKKGFNLNFTVPESIEEGTYNVEVKVNCSENITATATFQITVEYPKTISDFLSRNYVIVAVTDIDKQIASSLFPEKEILTVLPSKGCVLLLGGPFANPYAEDKCEVAGIKFEKDKVTFKGQTYRSTWETRDYGVVYLVDRFLLVMGSYRYGTKSSLIFVKTHPLIIKELIIHWYDRNSDHKVQIDEIIKIT